MSPSPAATLPDTGHTSFIVLWRTTGRGLRTLFETGSDTPLVATRDQLAAYTTTQLTDPDSLELDRRYLVSTQDARDWFGLDV